MSWDLQEYKHESELLTLFLDALLLCFLNFLEQLLFALFLELLTEELILFFFDLYFFRLGVRHLFYEFKLNYKMLHDQNHEKLMETEPKNT